MTTLTFLVSLAFIYCFSSTVEAICPNGWTKYGESCFALFETHSSWTESVGLCREFGGHLATLNTTEKRQQAKEYVTYIDHKAKAWIGASDLLTPGLFVWDVTGETVTNGDWAKGEPDRTDSSRCVVMDVNDHFQWHDHACKDKYDFLCEKRSVPES